MTRLVGTSLTLALTRVLTKQMIRIRESPMHTENTVISLLVYLLITEHVTVAHLSLQCSRQCGGAGEQTRQVWCASDSGDATADERCESALRPTDRRRCGTEPCLNTSWILSQWSQVSQSLYAIHHLSKHELENSPPGDLNVWRSAANFTVFKSSYIRIIIG